MTETTNPQGNVNDELVDIDDVEAHGLREVAAAAGIGAVVLGGGAAAMAASSSGTVPVPKTPAIVQQMGHDSHQLAKDATAGAQGIAGGALDDASALAGQALADAHTIADPTLHQVGADVNTVDRTAGTVVNDATSLTRNTTTHAVNLVNQTAGSTEKATFHAADQAVNDASATAGHAVKGADATVKSTEKTTIRVLGAAVNAVNKGWNLSFDVLGTKTSTGGNMLAPSGHISIVDASGATIASANVSNGKATLHTGALGHNENYTIWYSGDKVFGPSTIAWNLPTGI